MPCYRERHFSNAFSHSIYVVLELQQKRQTLAKLMLCIIWLWDIYGKTYKKTVARLCALLKIFTVLYGAIDPITMNVAHTAENKTNWQPIILEVQKPLFQKFTDMECCTFLESLECLFFLKSLYGDRQHKFWHTFWRISIGFPTMFK